MIYVCPWSQEEKDRRLRVCLTTSWARGPKGLTVEGMVICAMLMCKGKDFTNQQLDGASNHQAHKAFPMTINARRGM